MESIELTLLKAMNVTREYGKDSNGMKELTNDNGLKIRAQEFPLGDKYIQISLDEELIISAGQDPEGNHHRNPPNNWTLFYQCQDYSNVACANWKIDELATELSIRDSIPEPYDD